MRNLKGLVIAERDSGETGKLITLLTAELGCISVYVRGGRKSRKSLSSTQLFCYAHFSLEEKKQPSGEVRYYYNSSEPIRLFYEIRLDAKKLALACYFSELLRYGCESAENEDEVLRLTLNSLHFLDKGGRDPELLRSIFELRLLCETGYRPDLIGCHCCLKPEDDVMYIDLISGQLTCSECAEQLQNEQTADGQGLYVMPLSPALLHTVRFIALVEQERLFNFRVSERCQSELSAFTEGFLKLRYSRKFDSLNFYKML